MNDYSLRLAHQQFDELREGARHSRRTSKKRHAATWRRTTPKPTTE